MLDRIAKAVGGFFGGGSSWLWMIVAALISLNLWGAIAYIQHNAKTAVVATQAKEDIGVIQSSNNAVAEADQKLEVTPVDIALCEKGWAIECANGKPAEVTAKPQQFASLGPVGPAKPDVKPAKKKKKAKGKKTKKAPKPKPCEGVLCGIFP